MRLTIFWNAKISPTSYKHHKAMELENFCQLKVTDLISEGGLNPIV